VDDKRFKDENKKSFSINDDYEELLKSVDSYIGIEDDFIDISSGRDTEYEDVFSNSTEDIYFNRSKNTRIQDEDIYISRRQSRDIYTDVYSSERVSTPRNIQQETKVYQRPVRNNATHRVPPVKVDHKSNTQEIKRVMDDDEVSDYEERFGRKTTPTRKKKSKAPIVFVGIIAVFLAVIIGLGGVLVTTANSIMGEFREAEPIEHIEDVSSLASESNVRNILLIGADDAKGGTSRSDSIMIASINKTTGRITVVSILRDTHVDVPGHRESKINAAYSWGGANLLIQTIEQNFGIKIDDYATVDFEMFTALIDAMGGIDVEVTENEADYINNRHKYGKEEKPEYVPSGENVHLTGYQALWYARIRKLDSDFNRTERQRKVIAAIVKKAKDMSVFELVATAKEVAPYIETTLSTSDFWSLAFSLMSCVTKSGADMDKLLVSAQLPFEDTWWYSSQWDGSSISLDLEENRELLYQLLYEETTEETTENQE
jgi:LCP family protein required for cell wall assembly